MKPNGILWSVQAKLIRRGGLVGAKKIKPEEADSFIQSLRSADAGPKEEKIEEPRDHIAGGQLPPIPERATMDFAMGTDEWDVSPVMGDPPIQARSPTVCAGPISLPTNAKVNRDILRISWRLT